MYISSVTTAYDVCVPWGRVNARYCYRYLPVSISLQRFPATSGLHLTLHQQQKEIPGPTTPTLLMQLVLVVPLVQVALVAAQAVFLMLLVLDLVVVLLERSLALESCA